MKRRDASFRASSTIPRSTFPNSPKFSNPKITMMTSGKKNVQNMAARSRDHILIDHHVRYTAGFASILKLPKRPAGQIEENILQRGQPHFLLPVEPSRDQLVDQRCR